MSKNEQLTSDEWRAASESWQRVALEWREWGVALLRDLGMQPTHGTKGDYSTRNAIERLARAGRLEHAAKISK